MPKAFFDHLVFEKHLSKHTVAAYKTDLIQFEQFCKNQKINNLLSVTSKDIRRWIIFLLNEKLSSVTVHRKLSSLKAFYGFMQREGAINDNPAAGAILPKKQKKIPQFIKEHEIDTLFNDTFFENDFKGLRDKNILHLFYLTGMRRQELIDLKLQDIDYNRDVIIVTGKRNKMRSVPLPAWLLNQLKDYTTFRKDYSPDGHNLFITEKGKALYPKLVYRIVNKYISQIATLQKRSPHILRHTFATQMLNSGADLNAIKELLGHANLAATEVYTHNSLQKLKSTYNQAHPRS